MENIEEKLNQELLKCNTKLSWKETEILKNAFDLLYVLKCIFAKKESQDVEKLKNKILNNTKIKVAK